jgi:hypothetical protein
VTDEELTDDGEYSDIMEDMKEECGKYGTVVQVRRAGQGGGGGWVCAVGGRVQGGRGACLQQLAGQQAGILLPAG